MILRLHDDTAPAIEASRSTRQVRHRTYTRLRDLTRTIEAVNRLRDHRVELVAIRDDCRQMRLILDDGRVLLISVRSDEEGGGRLDADMLEF